MIGRVRAADQGGRLTFEYEAAWRESRGGYPLSVSMPLARITYPHKADELGSADRCRSQANMLNWFIGGTDAHAKNYSLLISADNEIRLAPLYDVSSQRPYPRLISQRVSMKIGDHYEIARIALSDWRKLAHACTIEEEHVMTMLTQMGRALPDHISAASEQALLDGLAEDAIKPLAQQL